MAAAVFTLLPHLYFNDDNLRLKDLHRVSVYTDADMDRVGIIFILLAGEVIEHITVDQEHEEEIILITSHSHGDCNKK